MTPAEKRVLINELANEFWPAKVVAPLGSDLGNSGFLYVELFFFDREDNDTLCEVVQATQVLMPDSVINVLLLDYSFMTGNIELYYELKPHGNLTSDIEDCVIDIVLESITESFIREQFAEFKSKFFEYMKSKPNDWHMTE